MDQQTLTSAIYIQEQIPNIKPKVGIILGSGLGDVVETIQLRQSLRYENIPNFPQSTILGHSGQLHLGQLGKVAVACLQGRVHFYEDIHPKIILNLMSTLYELGCRYLLVTNAAGSLHPHMLPGSLMLITDHINFQFKNVLVGQCYHSPRSPFIDMEEAYSPRLRQVLQAVAIRENIVLNEGVYVGVLGPSFETPAEIKAFARLGADAVGMSTIPEVIAARYYGLQVVGISVISNLAAGLTPQRLSHEHTLYQAQQAAQTLQHLITAFLNDDDFDAP